MKHSEINSKEDALQYVLIQEGGQLERDALIEKAQEIHPCREGADYVTQYKKAIRVLRNQSKVTTGRHGTDTVVSLQTSIETHVASAQKKQTSEWANIIVSSSTPAEEPDGFVVWPALMEFVQLQWKRAKKLQGKANFAILYGDPGLGKTMVMRYFSFKNNIPLVILRCNSRTQGYDIIGSQYPQEDRTLKFVAAPLTKSFFTSHKLKECIIVIEELSALPEDVQGVLLGPTDSTKGEFNAPGLDRMFTVDKDASLLVMGTANPAEMQGNSELGRALRSRASTFEVKHPPEHVERKILMNQVPGAPSDVVKKVISSGQKTRSMVPDPLDIGLCIRSEYILLDNWDLAKDEFGIDKANDYAVRCIVHRYPELDKQDRQTLLTNLNSIWATNLMIDDV